MFGTIGQLRQPQPAPMTRPMMPPVPMRQPMPQRPMMPMIRRAEGGQSNLSPDEAMVLRYWRGKPIQHFEGGGLAGGSNNGNKIGAAHDDTKSGNGGGGGSGNGGGQFDHQGNPVGPSTPGKSKYSGYQGGNDGSAAPGGNPGGGGTSSAPQNSREVDDAMAAKYGLSPQKYTAAAVGLGNRIYDAKDTGESTLNKFFKGLGSLVGAYEVDPTSGLNYGNTTNLNKAWSESLADADASVTRDPTGSADWHEDPFQALATAAGVITGAPIGSVYGGLTSTFGHPTVGQINLGPDVFGGGAPDMSKLTDSQSSLANADNYHGLEGSGSSDNGAAGSGGGAGKPGSGGSGTIGGLSSATGGTGGTGGKPAAGDTATDTPVAPVGTVIKPYTGDSLHYGEVGGEWKFLQPVTAARGGPIASPGMPTIGAMTQGGVKGQGSGQEDKIPAMLSDGEYVWSAQDVSDLGGGSTDDGVRKLDQMRQMIRQRAGRKNVKSIASAPHSIGSLLQKVA